MASSATLANPSKLHRIPPEVFERICFGLLNLPLSKRSHKHVGCRTVAALARTSRLFHEPALNVLWRTIPDIAVLFFTLPENIYRKSPPRKQSYSSEGCLLFSFVGRAPKEAHLERFLAYARRVRAIDHDVHHAICAQNYVAAPKAYDKLAKVLGARVLFPNVETIRYQSRDVAPMRSFHSFHVLFGPKLRELDIHSFDFPPASVFEGHGPPLSPEDEEAFALMLKKLRDVAPQLQVLDISMRPAGKTIASAAAAVVPDLKHLMSLRLSEGTIPLTAAAFAHLARLPHLTTLEFSADELSWANDLVPLAAAKDTLFPALCELNIIAPTLTIPAEVLRLVGSPRVAELSVRALKVVLRQQIDPFLAAIAGMRARAHVRELYVRVSDVVAHPSASPTNDSQPPRPIGRATLEPLLALSCLEDLLLDVRCPFDVDDTFLELAAASWPNIERLILGTTTSWGMLEDDLLVHGRDESEEALDLQSMDITHADDEPQEIVGHGFHVPRGPWRKPRATLFGLRALAQRNPHLDVLGLELNADLSEVPPSRLERRPLPGARRPPLDTLAVGLSPISDPFAVAALLSDAFPAVENIESSWEEAEDPYEYDEDEDEDGDGEEFGGFTLVESEDWSDARRFRKRWEAVAPLVELFALIRRQERRWKRKAAGLEDDQDVWLMEKDSDMDMDALTEESDDDDEDGEDHGEDGPDMSE